MDGGVIAFEDRRKGNGLALASAEVKKLKPAKAGNERVLEPASLNEMSEFYCKYS